MKSPQRRIILTRVAQRSLQPTRSLCNRAGLVTRMDRLKKIEGAGSMRLLSGLLRPLLWPSCASILPPRLKSLSRSGAFS